jgi:hypothetical protein
LQKERGVIEKREYTLKKHRKYVLQSKSIEKKKRVNMTPSKIKVREESQIKEYLKKQTKIFHTLAHLDQVA